MINVLNGPVRAHVQILPKTCEMTLKGKFNRSGAFLQGRMALRCTEIVDSHCKRIVLYYKKHLYVYSYTTK